MNNTRKKIANILTYTYGIGIAVALFVGAISILGYLVALILGGDIASNICIFIYKTLYPIIIYISSISVLIGLIKMYFAGEKSLTTNIKKTKNNFESSTSEKAKKHGNNGVN